MTLEGDGLERVNLPTALVSKLREWKAANHPKRVLIIRTSSGTVGTIAQSTTTTVDILVETSDPTSDGRRGRPREGRRRGAHPAAQQPLAR